MSGQDQDYASNYHRGGLSHEQALWLVTGQAIMSLLRVLVAAVVWSSYLVVAMSDARQVAM